MKNCDEMVNSLLERRKSYIAEQKRKKKLIVRTVASMCCVCLVSMVGISVWMHRMTDYTPSITIDDSSNIGDMDHIIPTTTQNNADSEYGNNNPPPPVQTTEPITTNITTSKQTQETDSETTSTQTVTTAVSSNTETAIQTTVTSQLTGTQQQAQTTVIVTINTTQTTAPITQTVPKITTTTEPKHQATAPPESTTTSKGNQEGVTPTLTSSKIEYTTAEITRPQTILPTLTTMPVLTVPIFEVNVINASINLAPAYYDPALHYEKTYNSKVINKYFGIDIIDAVNTLPYSLGISYVGNDEFCFTYQNDGTLVKDEVYYNFNGKNNSDIIVAVSKLYSPTGCIRYDTDTLNPTYIKVPNSDNTIEAYVYAHTKINDDYFNYKFYDILFDYNGNYYRISANNVSARNLKRLIIEIVS
ncbi:MAG: hypothetical protein IJN05_12640 [Ruminococcus sp.]|nr:hypothetical protein [Ruminococcus sp.]